MNRPLLGVSSETPLVGVLPGVRARHVGGPSSLIPSALSRLRGCRRQHDTRIEHPTRRSNELTSSCFDVGLAGATFDNSVGLRVEYPLAWHSPGREKRRKSARMAPGSVVRCHLAGGVAPTRSCGGGNQPLFAFCPVFGGAFTVRFVIFSESSQTSTVMFAMGLRGHGFRGPATLPRHSTPASATSGGRLPHLLDWRRGRFVPV